MVENNPFYGIFSLLSVNLPEVQKRFNGKHVEGSRLAAVCLICLLHDLVSAQCFNACYSPDRSISLKSAKPVSHREENLSSALQFPAASGRFCVGWDSGEKGSP